MEQMEIFNEDLGMIKAVVNKWLAENAEIVEITDVLQSVFETGARVLVTIFYRMK